MVRSRVAIPASLYADRYSGSPWQGEFPYWSQLGAPMVAPNGSVYVEVDADVWIDTCPDNPCYGTAQRYFDNTLSLLEVRPDGSTAWQTLKQYHYEGPLTTSSYDQPYPWVGEVIPDGQGGVLAAWTYEFYWVESGVPRFEEEARMTRVSGSGLTEYPMPWNRWSAPAHLLVYQPPNRSLVLGENGGAFATNGVSAASFNVESDAVDWTWEAPPNGFDMVAATAGNGLVGKVWEAGGAERVIRLDPTGQASYDDWTGNTIEYAYGDMWTRQGSAEVISAAANLWPYSIWARSGQAQARSAKVDLRVYRLSVADVSDEVVNDRVGSAIRYWTWHGILLDWDGTIRAETACPSLAGCDSQTDPQYIGDFRVNESLQAARLEEALRRFPDGKGVNVVFVWRLPESVAGYTISFRDSQGRLTRFGNTILMPDDPSHVLRHELGHAFQLRHIGPYPLVVPPH